MQASKIAPPFDLRLMHRSEARAHGQFLMEILYTLPRGSASCISAPGKGGKARIARILECAGDHEMISDREIETRISWGKVSATVRNRAKSVGLNVTSPNYRFGILLFGGGAAKRSASVLTPEISKAI